MYRCAAKRIRGHLAQKGVAYGIVLFAFAMSMGCHSLGEGDGLRQADGFANAKNYKELNKLLAHPLAQVRARALYHIARSSHQQAHEGLLSFVSEASELWRREALVQLFSSGRKDAHADIIFGRLCRDAHIEIKLATLAELGHRTHLTRTLWKCLLYGLRDRNHTVRWLAHLGLRQQSWHSLPHLHRALRKSKPPHTGRLLKLLQEITLHPWKQRRTWEKWFKSDGAKLFMLRYTGQWPKHKTTLKRLIAKGDSRTKREAARLLSRLAPPKEGLQLLLSLPNHQVQQAIAMWGESGKKHLVTLLTTRAKKVKEHHIRAFAGWLDARNQLLLLPYLNPKRPSLCHAAIAALSQYFAMTHRTHPAIAQVLKGLQNHPTKTIATEATAALWQLGHRHPSSTPEALLQLASQPNAERHLDALARWAAWTKDRRVITAMVGRIRTTSDPQTQRALLAALTYINRFTPIASAATTAFALGMRQPKIFCNTSYHFFHSLPPKMRYRWLLLYAPRLTSHLWRHLIGHLRAHPIPPKARVAITQLLRQAASNKHHWSTRIQAAHAISQHRIKPLYPMILTMLRTAPGEYSLSLVRIVERIRLAKALPYLQKQFRAAKTPSTQWAIALARWRCGDANAFRWCQKTLQRTKGSAWHVPRRFVRYLLEANEKAFLKAHRTRLKHIYSTPLAAFDLVQKPDEKGLTTLLKRYQRKLEPTRDRRFAIKWLQRQDHTWLKQLPTIAPTIEKRGQLRTLARLLASMSKGKTSQSQSAKQIFERLLTNATLSEKGRQLLYAFSDEAPAPNAPNPTVAQLKKRLKRARTRTKKRGFAADPKAHHALGDAHKALDQKRKAARAYVVALWHARGVKQQKKISQKLRQVLRALPTADVVGTTAGRPASRPTTTPTSRPTSRRTTP